MSFEVIGKDSVTTNMFEDLSAERKQLQKEGLLPEWYTTQAWQIPWPQPSRDPVRSTYS